MSLALFVFVYVNHLIGFIWTSICCLFCFVSASFIENPMVSSLSSPSHPHASVSNQITQSRRRRGRRPTRPPSSPNVPNLTTKRQSLQTKTPLHIHNRELAFRQLAEQLWAAGLPSSTTACSMSVRSRCSSAPPSERGGGEEEMNKIDWNNTYDAEDEENNVDWDEPDKPDEGNNSRQKKHVPLLILNCFARTHVASMTIDCACFARSNT